MSDPEIPSTSPTLAAYIGLWPTCQPFSQQLQALWDDLDDQARRAAMLRTPPHDEAMAAQAGAQSSASRASWAQHMMVQVLADLSPVSEGRAA